MPAEPPPEFVSAFLPIARAEVERDRAMAGHLARTDRRAFRMKHRRLDSGALYGDVFQPWQEEHFFAPIDAGMSIYDEAPRGHDRTDGEGWQICTDLQYGQGNQQIVIIAADKDQAALPLERCARYAHDFPWLFPNVVVQKHTIYGPNGSRCVVLSADAASSLGLKPTAVWVEEIGAWPKRGQDLWTNVIGACAKLDAPIRVLTNATAGKTGNWRWQVRESFRALAEQYPDRYHFWSAPGWVAEWSRAKIAELETIFPSENDRARFIHNRTLEEDENAAFSIDDREAVFARDYRIAGDFVEVQGEEPRRIVAWVASADFGLKDDALCEGSVALTTDEHCWLADDLALAGRPGDEASIATAEAHLLAIAARRRLLATLFDPHQAAGTMQRIGGQVSAEEFTWTLASKRDMYSVLLAKVRARKFHAKPDAFRRTHHGGQVYDLHREMVEAVEHRTASNTFVVHTGGGHDDGLAVVQMCLIKLSACSLEPAAVSVPEDRPERGWRPYRDRALSGRRR